MDSRLVKQFIIFLVILFGWTVVALLAGPKIIRLLKNAHLRRSLPPSSLRRTSRYASTTKKEGDAADGRFQQPIKIDFPAAS